MVDTPLHKPQLRLVFQKLWGAALAFPWNPRPASADPLFLRCVDRAPAVCVRTDVGDLKCTAPAWTHRVTVGIDSTGEESDCGGDRLADGSVALGTGSAYGELQDLAG